MKKEWFVLQTLTGKENKVRDSIKARVPMEGMEDYVGECQIPTEKVTETKDGKKRILTKKVFPGYVLVQLALYQEGGGIDKETGARAVVPETWQFLRETPGVIGSWLQQRPMPLRQEEVDAILSNKPVDGASRPRPNVEFTVGQTVKIKDNGRSRQGQADGRSSDLRPQGPCRRGILAGGEGHRRGDRLHAGWRLTRVLRVRLYR